MSRLRDWLELARISNLPTVWSNVLVGLVLGHLADVDAGIVTGPRPSEWRVIADLLAGGGWYVLGAVSLMYIAGMLLNDWADRHTDAEQRRTRPIPSGRVSARAVLIGTVVPLAAAFGLLAMTGRTAPLLAGALLVACIIAYDLLHRKQPGTIVLMGICRGLVYAVAASLATTAFEPRWFEMVLPAAIVLTLFTVGITHIARMEDARDVGKRRWWAIGMIGWPILTALFIWPHGMAILFAVVAAFVLIIWFIRAAQALFHHPPQTKTAVLTWLSGICLIDAFNLSLMSMPLTALLAGACFVCTVLLHRRIMGT